MKIVNLVFFQKVEKLLKRDFNQQKKMPECHEITKSYNQKEPSRFFETLSYFYVSVESRLIYSKGISSTSTVIVSLHVHLDYSTNEFSIMLLFPGSSLKLNSTFHNQRIINQVWEILFPLKVILRMCLRVYWKCQATFQKSEKGFVRTKGRIGKSWMLKKGLWSLCGGDETAVTWTRSVDFHAFMKKNGGLIIYFTFSVSWEIFKNDINSFRDTFKKKSVKKKKFLSAFFQLL